MPKTRKEIYDEYKHKVYKTLLYRTDLFYNQDEVDNITAECKKIMLNINNHKDEIDTFNRKCIS